MWQLNESENMKMLSRIHQMQHSRDTSELWSNIKNVCAVSAAQTYIHHDQMRNETGSKRRRAHMLSQMKGDINRPDTEGAGGAGFLQHIMVGGYFSSLVAGVSQ